MTDLIWGEWYKTADGGKYRHVPLHVGQKAIWDSDARFLAMIAGKGSAKSSFAPIWLDREIRRNPQGSFILCAPSYKMLNQGLTPHWIKHMRFNDLNPYPDSRKALNETKGVYQLSTGGVVWLRSLDDPETINAIHAHAAVCDEAGNVPLSAWNILESRVSQKVGKVLLTTTPYARYGWLKEEIISKYHSGDKNYFVFQGASTINPSFDQAEFERLKKSKAPHVFARDYEGQFTQAVGAVYPDFLSCMTDVPKGGLPNGTYFGGIDFGYGGSDPTVCLAGVLDIENVLWIFWERYVAKEDIEQTSVGMRQWHNAFAQKTGRTVSKWACDHQPSYIRYLRHYRLKPKDNHDEPDKGPSLNCCRASKGAGSIDFGIDLVNTRIKTGTLKIIRGPVSMLPIEGDGYIFDQDEDGKGSGRPKGMDHALDALRYMVTYIWTKYKK